MKEKPSDMWMGFDSRYGRLIAGEGGIPRDGMVPAGATVAITSRPQIGPFRGERLCVWSVIASSFLIHSIRVGHAEQLLNGNPIPADSFATRMDKLAAIEEAFKRDGAIEIKIDKSGSEFLGSPITLPTCQIATDMTMIVENLFASPLRFVAGLMGKGIQAW